MNLQQFEKLAHETGAYKCLDFDWSYTLKDSCMRNYTKDGTYCPCVMLIGKECEHFTKGLTE